MVNPETLQPESGCAASTIATIPALTGSGRAGQASITKTRSRGVSGPVSALRATLSAIPVGGVFDKLLSARGVAPSVRLIGNYPETIPR